VLLLFTQERRLGKRAHRRYGLPISPPDPDVAAAWAELGASGA